jgi:hypothetical protein
LDTSGYFDVLWVYNLVISLVVGSKSKPCENARGLHSYSPEGKKELRVDRKTAGRERRRGQGAQERGYRPLLNKQYAGKARFHYFSHRQNLM